MRSLYSRFILWLIRPALERHACGVKTQQDWDRCAEQMYRSLGPPSERGSR